MKNLTEETLMNLEKRLNAFLVKNISIMPTSFCKWIMSYYPNAHIRKEYFKKLGGEIGENSFFNTGFVVSPNNDMSYLKIGNHVSIAPNVTCICESNANNGIEINKYSYITDRITKKGNIEIADEAWIGANVTILPGVKIGKCAVVGAGSVVIENLEPYGVYAGVPAKKIKDIRTEGMS